MSTLTVAQRVVLARLRVKAPPENQPTRSETYTIDALLRLQYIRKPEGASDYEITSLGAEALDA